MNDYIEIPSAILITGAVAAGIYRFGGLIRFFVPWQCLMGGVAIANAVVSSFMVMSFGQSFGFAGVFGLWMFLWIILFWKYIRNENSTGLKLLFSYPALHMLILWSSTAITNPQIAEARAKGEILVERLVSYEQKNGEFPSSLEELSAYDHLEIPETGIGLWGPQDYYYSTSDWFTAGSISFGEFSGIRHSLSPGEEWWSGD